MKVYTTKSVAKMLDLRVEQVRSYARSGLLDPERGPRGEYRFSFQDLVLLRTAKGLMAARIAPRKVRSALKNLRRKLPRGRPLTGVQITADGDRVVVRAGGKAWNPETGQGLFNFEVSELATRVAPHARKAARDALASHGPERELTAEEWFTLAVELEPAAPDQAQEFYRRALDLDPDHFHTRVNLGRLLHEAGRLNAAEAHYRLALSLRADDPTALFNLAVCLEDMGQSEEAIRLYRRTVRCDPECADAYYNLARLYEYAGDSAAALRHLKTYRKLTEQP